MKQAAVENFNLKATLESGQIFRWEKIGEWYYVVVGTTILKLKQQDGKIIYDSNETFDVLNFFDLKNKDYKAMLKNESNDDVTAAAIKKYKGLRIIKQEPWECTASFICTSLSNIKRITKNLNAIAKAYGKKMELGGYVSYTFPSAFVIAKNTKKLGNCGLGYREKYLANTAKKINEGFDLMSVKMNGYEEAKQKMMALDGVGTKWQIAYCFFHWALQKLFL